VVDNAEGCRDCYGHTLMHVAHRYDADSTENTVMTTISRDGTAHQDGQWLVSVETHVAGAPNKSVVTGYVSTPAQVTAFFAEHLPAALARLAAQLVTV
jgi:phosphoribosylformimino-5-aminoimidazole carboxamide ribonucleotide (ProFAR) isomerase